MFKLPYLQEVFWYTLAVDVDLCTAGNLKDPLNGKHIRKGLTIVTTSPKLSQELQGYRCAGHHEHQVIEGQTKVNGQNVLRSAFTEQYPRKFARQLATILCKLNRHREPPYRSLQLLAETLVSGEHPDAPASKKPRVRRQKVSRVREVSQLPWGKRLRQNGKTTPLSNEQNWEQIMNQVNKLVPRVGKVVIRDSTIVQEIQNLITDKQIQFVVASRGTSRTIPPPFGVQKGEAPFRRSVFTERGTGNLKAEEEWEYWEDLAKRNIVRPSHPTKLNITMFAKTMEKTVTKETAETSQDSQPLTTHPNSQPFVGQTPTVETPLEPSTYPFFTATQKADLQSPQQSLRFKALSREEQTVIIKAHKNLGHPSPEKLSTLFRMQGYRPEIAQAALEFRCSVCTSHSNPKLARPGNIKDDLDFNDRICADGITWTNKDGTTFHMQHIVDWSTNFQAACIAPDRSSQATIQNTINMWLSWAGTPCELIVDAATEFNADEFAAFAQAHNIRMTTISTEAPFQNGKAERHGSILKTMLSKYEMEHPVNTYQDLNQALFWCVQAKNACSLRRGYAPEVLVLGKHTRLPGSVRSDELLPAHLLSESETAQGLQFRKQLAAREAARKAFVLADNDASLRRALLRRSRPGGQQYHPGEWVMIWKEGKGAYQGSWMGPMKIVVHENQQTIWVTGSSKLYRVAPEHVRPVTANEAKEITMESHEPSISTIAQQLPLCRTQGTTRAIDLPTTLPTPLVDLMPQTRPAESTESSTSEGQPDDEPEAQAETPPNVENPESNIESTDSQRLEQAVETPVPTEEDDELQCVGLYCVDHEPINMLEGNDVGWRFEVDITEQDLDQWRQEPVATDMAFVVSAAKKQRAEVKLSTLTNDEKEQFQKAKESEVQNWIKTGTISKILRDKVPYDQIIRCRWILTWKPIDDPDENQVKQGRTTKAKARLVILGYLDPKLEELPRDSPTLGRHAKMLLLQLIASKQWDLQSFDIRAAFLQGKSQPDRTLAVEPVPELIQSLQLRSNEVCKLEKGAYGLVDAPYLWYLAITEALAKLGFSQSPFDPCLFLLRHPNTGNLEGVLGLHVDDGICGGTPYFQQKLDALEKQYPFGTKKHRNFTFTGIEMNQMPDGTITMNQSTYVKKINPISINNERRTQPEEKVTEAERQDLRALVGSLQYASVNTRPDLASRLSVLQSSINSATIATLITANQTLHEAKRYHDTTIRIQSIATEHFRFLAFSDASFASKSNPSSHTGCIIMGTHQKIKDNMSCVVNPLAWSCKKIQRVVTSTLAAETVSLNSVLDQLSWMRLCWAWMLDPTIDWKNPSRTLKTLPETYTTATYQSQQLPESFAATDCKSLYDLVTRTAMPNCAEYRTQLTARSIKDLLSEGVSLRWVHSGAQLADCLTKVMETSFLRETLKQGKHRLHDELQVLKNRASARNRLKWLKEAYEQPAGCDGACNNDCLLLL